MERTLTALLAQSRKPDEVIVLASDIDLEEVRKKHTGVTFYAEPNLNDWGHAKRAKGLDLATKDYIGWFNHDDSYDPHYIAEMMWLAELGSDVVYPQILFWQVNLWQLHCQGKRCPQGWVHRPPL